MRRRVLHSVGFVVSEYSLASEKGTYEANDTFGSSSGTGRVKNVERITTKLLISSLKLSE